MISKFPKIMKDAMVALQELHEVPEELAIVTVLGVANHATHALYDVKSEMWKSGPTSLYLMALCPSGARKSTVVNEVSSGTKGHARKMASQFQNDYPIYDAQMELWKKEVKKEVAAKTGVKPIKPTPIIGGACTVDKTTQNGHLNLMYDNQHIGMINPDAAEFFNSHSFQGNQSATEYVSTLSKLWSGEDVQRQTGVRETNVLIQNKRFMMLCMMQSELAEILEHKKHINQGFVPRILYVQVPFYKTTTRSLLEDHSHLDTIREEKLDPFNSRAEYLLDQVGKKVITISGAQSLKAVQFALSNTQTAEDPRHLFLDEITLTDAARKVYAEFNTLNDIQKYEPKYIKFESFMARRYEQALRLAATISIFDKRKFIDKDEAELSIALIKWFTDHRINLELDTGEGSDIVDMADKVANWMHSRFEKKGITAYSNRQITQSGPSAMRKWEVRKRILVIEELEDRGIISLDTDVDDLIYIGGNQ